MRLVRECSFRFDHFVMKQVLLALTGLATALPPDQKTKRTVPEKSTYAPLSSVWEGTDSELLEAIFSFYAVIAPEPILDSTYNAGRIWKGSARQVISMDLDRRYKPMIVGDNRKMAGVPDAAFGAVIYDPPHVGPQGRDKSRKKFDVDFGATVECGKAGI